MAIIKEKNGSYTLHYTKHDPLTLKTSRTKKRGFKTLREAKEYERTLSRERSDVLFITLFEEKLANTEQTEQTKFIKRSFIKNYMPSLLTIRYEDVTKAYLLNLRSEIAKTPRNNKTKNTMLNIVTQTCRYANEVYDLPDYSKVIKRFKTVKKEFSVWSPEQYFQFENALDGIWSDCAPFFRTLFFTGLRYSEARALTVDDLDIENATLTVSKSMNGDISTVKAPKTPSGVRKVKLDVNTLEMLKPLKTHEKWLFGDFRPFSVKHSRMGFDYGIKKSGVPRIRIHDLRHSHASYLIANKVNIVAVSKRLGHSSVNMTMSVYAHLFDNADDEIIDLLNVATSLPLQKVDSDKSL